MNRQFMAGREFLLDVNSDRHAPPGATPCGSGRGLTGSAREHAAAACGRADAGSGARLLYMGERPCRTEPRWA